MSQFVSHGQPLSPDAKRVFQIGCAGHDLALVCGYIRPCDEFTEGYADPVTGVLFFVLDDGARYYYFVHLIPVEDVDRSIVQVVCPVFPAWGLLFAIRDDGNLTCGSTQGQVSDLVLCHVRFIVPVKADSWRWPLGVRVIYRDYRSIGL